MPKLSWTGARWEMRGYPAFKDQFKQAGFHFDWRNKIWWSGLTEVARKFEGMADDVAKAKLNAQDNQIALSKATDSNIIVAAPSGLEYLPFQKGGIAYAAPRPDVLIADEMGLGKTIQAIGLINYDPTIKSILIVPPAGLLLNWGRELQKWMVRRLSGDYATGSKLPRSNIVLANYELLSRLKPQIMQRQWDLIVFDESHYLKNPDTKRTMAALGHEDTKNMKDNRPLEARRRLFLTGTPILNRPVELWPMLRVIDPEGLGANFWLFAKKFCGAYEGDYGRDFSGASNLDILQTRLRSNLMIRRLKKDVLKELPPKRRQIIAIPGDEAKQVVQRELNFYNNNATEIEQAIEVAAVAQAIGDTATYNEAAGDLRSLRKTMFEEMSKLRHDTAVAKVPYLIQYLENALEQEDKIVLFAHHQDVIRPILEKFSRIAVKFDGTMSKVQKQLSVDRFQDANSGVKLFIGSITAAGVGITLTESSYVLFAELDWRPGIITQAEDRVHRIGQLESVLVQHIVFDNSLDANMVKKIVEKQEVIDAAIG